LRKTKKRLVILLALSEIEGRAVCAPKDLNLSVDQSRKYKLHFSFLLSWTISTLQFFPYAPLHLPRLAD